MGDRDQLGAHALDSPQARHQKQGSGAYENQNASRYRGAHEPDRQPAGAGKSLLPGCSRQECCLKLIEGRINRGHTMAKAKLTETYIKGLPLPTAHHALHHDTETRGLAVRITRTGARSFLFCYSFDGQERRMSLGPWAPPVSNKLGAPATLCGPRPQKVGGRGQQRCRPCAGRHAVRHAAGGMGN